MFERLVRRAFRQLPREWRERLHNVAVVIEEEPPPGQDQVGLYEGVAWAEAGASFLPQKITIYRRPLEASCASRQELEWEVRRTLWHEIGHYFGLEESQLEALEHPEVERRNG